MKLIIDILNHHGTMPKDYTCDGQNISPHITWSDAPASTKSFVLIVDDPDAPQHTPFVHWVVFNIPAAVHELPTAVQTLPGNAKQGVNDFGKNQYGGACPPVGDKKHRYFFKLYALDTELDLPEGATKHEVEKAMHGHVVDQAEVVGVYERFHK